MKTLGRHLIFYDGTCGMCHRAVQFLLKWDKNKLFVFSPLQGKAAARMLPPHINEDLETLILVENYQDNSEKRVFTFGKGAFRICWLLGGFWSIFGAISFLPSFLYDWAYRWVAHHRFQWFVREECLVPKNEDMNRFLK